MVCWSFVVLVLVPLPPRFFKAAHTVNRELQSLKPVNAPNPQTLTPLHAKLYEPYKPYKPCKHHKPSKPHKPPKPHNAYKAHKNPKALVSERSFRFRMRPALAQWRVGQRAAGLDLRTAGLWGRKGGSFQRGDV